MFLFNFFILRFYWEAKFQRVNKCAHRPSENVRLKPSSQDDNQKHSLPCLFIQLSYACMNYCRTWFESKYSKNQSDKKTAEKESHQVKTSPPDI